LPSGYSIAHFPKYSAPSAVTGKTLDTGWLPPAGKISVSIRQARMGSRRPRRRAEVRFRGDGIRVHQLKPCGGIYHFAIVQASPTAYVSFSTASFSLRDNCKSAPASASQPRPGSRCCSLRSSGGKIVNAASTYRPRQRSSSPAKW
jgi:hypothetical protein